MRTSLLLAAVGVICVPLLSSDPAHAQATRTWVSGVGDDANPCSRTAPCKTFAGAISKTAPGGIINCIDPGGFGAVTITKSITLDCAGTLGGVLAAGTNAINVNVTSTDIVILRNLDIEGVGTGLIGVNFIQAGVLHIDNCKIFGFRSGTAMGVRFIPTGAAELYVTDSYVSDNGGAGTGAGIQVQVAPGSTSKAVINNTKVNNNSFGIKAEGTGGGGGVINMTVRESVSAGNTNNGIVGTTPVGGANIVMMVDRSASSHNAAFGVIADGAATTIRVGGSSITGNGTGVGASNGGTLRSYKNNQIDGNSSDGTPVTQVFQN